MILCQDRGFVNIKLSRSWVHVCGSCQMLLAYLDLLLQIAVSEPFKIDYTSSVMLYLRGLNVFV